MTGDQDPRSHKLNEIIAEYLQAVENGRAPSREEQLARQPELADQMGKFFERYAAIQCAAAGSADPHRDDVTVAPAPQAPDEATLPPNTSDTSLPRGNL